MEAAWKATWTDKNWSRRGQKLVQTSNFLARERGHKPNLSGQKLGRAPDRNSDAADSNPRGQKLG